MSHILVEQAVASSQYSELECLYLTEKALGNIPRHRHTGSPGQIRYGNPSKTRFYPIISVVLLLSGPTTATLSSPFQSAISLSAAQILLHPYIAGSL